MEEKTIQRIKKLQALAERGVGGEKETAAKMLQRLLEKNGISTLEELEKEEVEYFLFSYKGRHEIKLLYTRMAGQSTETTEKGTKAMCVMQLSAL